MSAIKVECPECLCQLQPPSGAATGMTCPRCKTWLEFDARCAASCMSCFKNREAEPAPCCSSEAPAAKTEPAWKRLIQRLFAVR